MHLCRLKHRIRTSAHQLVSAGKGGGQQVSDLDKTMTLSELKNNVVNIYFPNGKSIFNNHSLVDLNTYMANFAGVGVKEVVPHIDGDWNGGLYDFVTTTIVFASVALAIGAEHLNKCLLGHQRYRPQT